VTAGAAAKGVAISQEALLSERLSLSCRDFGGKTPPTVHAE